MKPNEKSIMLSGIGEIKLQKKRISPLISISIIPILLSLLKSSQKPYKSLRKLRVLALLRRESMEVRYFKSFKYFLNLWKVLKTNERERKIF